MTENLGTARIDIVVDTSSMEAAIQRAQSLTSSMSQQAQAEYAKLNAADKRRVESLIRQAETLGMTRQEQILYNAALRGVPTAVLDDLKRRLAAVGTQAQVNTLSVKQMQQAIRGVPAQITDIVVSLQGGTNPLTVLLQQGGQLRDMFGGIGPAVRALGSSLASIINPVTVFAAATVGLVVAWEKGQAEAREFNKAIILTGNYAGVTADQMALMAVQMDRLSGVTTSSAAEALARVAETGRFTGEQMQLVAQAAEQMRAATGRSIEETIDEFQKIRKDPVNALLELNDKYHFLTQAQLDRIRTLKDEGREQEAVTEAVRIYADVLDDRTGQVVENLGLIERSWRGIKTITGEVIDELLNIGRTQTPAMQAQLRIDVEVSRLRSIQRNIERGLAEGREFTADAIAAYNREIENAKRVIAEQKKILAREAGTGAGRDPNIVDSDKARKELEELKEAAQWWRQTVQSDLDKEGKLREKINKIREVGAKLGKSEAEIQKQIAQAQARYMESLPKARKATDPGESILARLRRQIALNQEQLRTEEKLTANERIRVEVMQELERIGAKIPAQTRARIEAALAELKVTGDQAEALERKRRATEQLARLENQLAQRLQNQRRGNQISLLELSTGGDTASRLRRQLEIYQEYEDELARLRDKGVAADSEAYRQQVEALRKALEEELALEREFQDQLAKIRGSANAGAVRALEDYIAAGKDVNAQMYEIWSNGLMGLEDAFVDFFTKGKADWRGFLDGIAADITRFIVRQQLTKLAEKFLPGLKGGDQASALSKAAGELAASAGPLIGAASALSGAAAALAAAGLGSQAGSLLGGQGASGGNWISSLMNAFSGMGWGGIAMGGAFGYGQRLDKFALGGVVNSPTLFQHGARVGLMGEAGPEAIVPLHRGPDGKLGVKMAQPSAAPAPVTLSQTFVIEGRLDSTTQEQLSRRAGREARRAMARTGA